MKLAIKTCTLDMPYEEMLDFCVSQKIAAIEIGTGNWSGAPHCDLDLLVSDRTAREKWYDAMRAKGLELCALNCSGNPLAYEKEMDVTKKTFELAQMLGVKKIVMMSGLPAGCRGDKTPVWITTSWPPETQEILDYQWNEVAIPVWKDIVKMAEDCGIERIALENHGMQLVYNPETLLRLREAVGPMVGMNLDPSHLFWMGGDPIEAARVLGEHGAALVLPEEGLDGKRLFTEAAALLREIGILTADGKLKNDMIRKYNQIDHYVELVAPMFEQDDSDEIVLLDCACGKSYLSFVMNYYLHEVLHRRCRVIGVDIKEHVIDESRAMAKRLGYHNMSFQCADLRVYQPPKNVTAVISLHACDIATDLALATALRARAKYIACVPCCHKELLDQYTMPGLEPLTRHGVFKARFNDVLTDSMRALKLEAEGYKVSVVEYISPLDTPKNLLIRAVRTGRENRRAKADYEAVRRTLGTTSELDRRCMDMENEFFVTDEDLIP